MPGNDMIIQPNTLKAVADAIRNCRPKGEPMVEDYANAAILAYRKSEEMVVLIEAAELAMDYLPEDPIYAPGGTEVFKAIQKALKPFTENVDV